MFIELVDFLRCLAPHEESWLVAVSRRMEGRSIVDGALGCPVCRREYPVVGGAAYFGVDAVEPPPRESSRPADEEEALRLAAFLDLATPGGIVVLSGDLSLLAPALRALAQVSCVLLDPPVPAAALVGDGIAVLRTGGTVPLAPASVRGIALDRSRGGETEMAAAVRVLATGGRLVAPSTAAVPGDVRELARDDMRWVGERRPAPSPPVTIARGARAPR